MYYATRNSYNKDAFLEIEMIIAIWVLVLEMNQHGKYGNIPHTYSNLDGS